MPYLANGLRLIVTKLPPLLSPKKTKSLRGTAKKLKTSNYEKPTRRFRTITRSRSSGRKWGEAISAGYQVCPTPCCASAPVKLSATDVVVIANLNSGVWYSERLPYLQPTQSRGGWGFGALSSTQSQSPAAEGVASPGS